MSEEHAESAPNSQPIWVSGGIGPDDVDYIVGSSAGLRILREHIDLAIRDGKSSINHPRIEFRGIKCSDMESYSFVQRLAFLNGFGVIAFISCIVLLAIIGAISLFR